MKTTQKILIAAASALLVLPAMAQEIVRETVTTRSGIVSSTEPDRLVVATEDTPVRYTYTKTTKYFDEAGNPMTVEVIKKGQPVTVYYTRSGDELVASKVVVRSTTTPAGDVTTTTTVKPIEAAGTLVELADGTLALKTEAAATPVRYRYSKTTKWVDENGNVVTSETVKTGAPVTVVYTKNGDRVEVAKVIVRKAQPVIIERKTTTTVTEEKKKKDDDKD
jgi:hypothetical protein